MPSKCFCTYITVMYKPTNSLTFIAFDDQGDGMNQSIFDITNLLLPVMPLCTDTKVNQQQADYLRPIILNVLVAVSNPRHYPRLEVDMQSWDPQGREVFIRLHRALQPTLIQHTGKLLTIVDVSVTPVNYQITIGHGV